MKKIALLAGIGLVTVSAFAQQAPASPDRDPALTTNQSNLAPKVLPGESRTTDKMIVRNAKSRAVIEAERDATLHPKKAAKPTATDRQAAAEGRKSDGRAAARDSQTSIEAATPNADGAPKASAKQPG